MQAEISSLSASTTNASDCISESNPVQVSQNIESIAAFYVREEQKIGRSQRLLEHLSDFLGSPLYLGLMLGFVALWMFTSIFAKQLGLTQIDPAPFYGMHLMLSLGGVITATVVLIKQNRLSKLEEQHAHLDLQVNLLTEQKVTKIINLLEELRRDLPMVKDRLDVEAIALQQPTDPKVVLAALDEQRESTELPIQTKEGR
jgi:uncharacterized membrane protein